MKKIFAIILSLVVVLSMSTTALAAENPSSGFNAGQGPTPRISWNGTAVLKTDTFYNITSSNNLFSDYPLVKSDGNNPGTVIIRVIDKDGQQVGEAKTVEPGFSIRLDKIPFNSGTYTIQGQAYVEGNYRFVID